MGDTNLGPEPSLEQKPNMKAEKQEWPQSGPTHIPPPTPSLYFPSPQGISRWGKRQDPERLGYFPRATQLVSRLRPECRGQAAC